MKASTICPCCSTTLLHHFGNHREYWFCRHCWSEMPDLEIAQHQGHQKLPHLISLSSRLSGLNRSLLI